MLLYVVVPLIEVTDSMLNVSKNYDIDQLRVDVSSDNCILKFNSEDSLAREILVSYKWYTREDFVKNVLTNGNW